MHETDLLTANEVAAAARVSPTTVIQWVRRGVIPGIRVGGSWRFRRSDIDQLLTPVTPDPIDRPDR